MLLSNVNKYIRKENFIVVILNKLVFFVMFSSYIIKELKKRAVLHVVHSFKPLLIRRSYFTPFIICVTVLFFKIPFPATSFLHCFSISFLDIHLFSILSDQSYHCIEKVYCSFQLEGHTQGFHCMREM